MASENKERVSFQTVIKDEFKIIRKLRKINSPPDQTNNTDNNESDVPENLVGLAFSGGGIRSATFGLGVLEALKKEGLLKKIDYLSTVSGGAILVLG